MQNTVMDAFFETWTQKVINWFAETKAEYAAEMQADHEADGGRFNRNRYLATLQRWQNRLGKGDLQLIQYNTLKDIEATVRKEMAAKKAQVYRKIGDKAGEIAEVNLHTGDDGTPNGRVTGTNGTVYITTILAGGYNIQKLHYRVLVK